MKWWIEAPGKEPATQLALDKREHISIDMQERECAVANVTVTVHSD